MPTYEYACEKCGHHFELVQSMTAQAITTCTKEVCPRKSWGKGRVKRAISGGAGLIFKGTGFYITDYRSENYKAGEKKESSAASGSSGGGSDSGGGKSETKPAAKAEAKPAPKAESKPAKKDSGKS
jgi:putative FmdB family regulatory protein